ncbi:MAG: hypothetical protein ACXVCO_18530 [Ktedonobacterales bacterium]
MSIRRTPKRRIAGRMHENSYRDTTALALLRLSLGSRRFVWMSWAGGAALALLLAVGLSFMGQSTSHQVASAAPAQRAWLGRASAPELPSTIHFYDLHRNTAYTVWLRDTAERKAGSFVFTLSDHTQLSGFAPITQAEDNSFIQDTNQVVSTNAAVDCPGHAATESGEYSAIISLQARIDASGLVAYAQVNNYVVCRATQRGKNILMESGCTLTACTDVLAQAGPAVQQYGSSIVAASADRSQDAWNKVYAQVSQTTRGQYTAEQFATQLNKQIESVGQITAVSPITSPPVLQYDTAGQAFFAVKQQITYHHNGTTTTRDSTSYFLMEGGQWVFWFSA